MLYTWVGGGGFSYVVDCIASLQQRQTGQIILIFLKLSKVLSVRPLAASVFEQPRPFAPVG